MIAHNTLKGQIRLRLDESREIIEMTADEMRAQYGSAVRPEELEQQVEEPLRDQDRRRREALVATLDPVDAPSQARPAASDGEQSSTEDGADQPKRRRRRGRRGGRRRKRGGGGSGEGGSFGSAS